MNRRYVEVARTRSERRVPRGVTSRQAIEAILMHLNSRLEVSPLIPTGKLVDVVPDRAVEK